MDYNKNNRLTDENQKWLDDLLNTPDSQEVGAGELAKQFAKPEEVPVKISEEEQAILEAEALVADEAPVADIDDADLEKILAEEKGSLRSWEARELEKPPFLISSQALNPPMKEW